MWEHQPRAMRVALARHDSIMRAAIEQHRGHVFKTVGDAFYAVFPSALDALTAAVEAQRTLQPAIYDATGEGNIHLRVRMALHTGESEHRENDYFGPTLNRVARLLSAGYGGQILLSTATQQLVRERLPDGINLRDLGAGGLKGLTRPEYIYQVVARGLQENFPPLRVLDTGLARVAITTNGNGALPPHNPYKGLRAFNEADAGDFFGRESLVARLLARMDEPSPLARFLAITGPSGSGKSSAVSAGLMPALKAGRLPGSDRWIIIEMLPGALPIEELEGVLRSVAVTASEPDMLKNDLFSGSDGLIRAANRVLPPDESVELVLVIDQFEEIFTQVTDEPARVHFLNILHTAVSNPESRVRVLVTLRADFYDRPLLYPNPGTLVRERTEVVLPLTAEELERAIVRPAERAGVKLEPELVTTILQDVNDEPGTLPLMQYTLTELFEHRQGNTLTLAAYRSSGGVLGTLARSSDEIYEKSTPQEQEETRQLFLRLVTLGEGTEDTRRRVRMAELLSASKDVTALTSVVDRFGRYRLLTFDRDSITHDRTVEVAHEALIRSWDRMRGWLQSSREQVRMHRHLIQASGEWLVSGKDPSFLASGARLSQYEVLAYEEDLVLTREEKAFVEASVTERERGRVAREQMRRRITIGLAVGLILTLVLAALAILQSVQADEQRNVAVAESHARATAEANAQERQQEAETQQRIAFSRELAAKSVTQIGINPNLSLLLAIEAVKTSQTVEAEEALRLALVQSQPHSELRLPNGQQLFNAAFSPDGKWVATTGNVSTRVWDVSENSGTSGNLVAELTLAKRATVRRDNLLQRSAAFSPDGKMLLIGSDDGIARIWDIQQQKILVEMPGHSNVLTCVTFNPDGKRVATASNDNTARVWDAATGKTIAVLEGHTARVTYVDFSPDGKRVVTSSADNTARVWDASTGRTLLVLSGHTGGVNSAAFSPDGKRIVTSSNDKTARVWDAATGAVLLVIEGHKDNVYSASFSPDGKMVITGSADATAAIWDAGNGQSLANLSMNVVTSPSSKAVINTAEIDHVAFSPDGKRVLLTTGVADGAAWVYPWGLFTPVKQLENLASTLAPRPFTCEERQTYLHEPNACGTPTAQPGR